MGDFRAVFVKVDGLEETSLARRELNAETLEEAEDEALACTAPGHHGANMIDIYREGQKVRRIGVGL